MTLFAQIEITPQFYDCDPMGVVWHGNYLRFFEQVRVVMMENIEYSYKEMADSGFIWPIIDIRIKYVKPVQLGQLIIVKANMLEYENRLRIGYEISDAADGSRLTKGQTTQVAVKSETGEMCFVSPHALQDRIKGT